jgi:hypothetical protein
MSHYGKQRIEFKNAAPNLDSHLAQRFPIERGQSLKLEVQA